MDELLRASTLGAACDVVEWRVYVSGADDPSPDALRDALSACLTHAAPLLRGYVWQRDPFTLEALPAEAGAPACLGGSARVGDAVEDEWFIAWLLFDLTRALPRLAARRVCALRALD